MNTIALLPRMPYLLLLMIIVSCNKYLDVLPDNRTEINTDDKIAQLLVSAYPSRNTILAAELASDNSDDRGPENPYGTQFMEQIFNWQESTEIDSDDLTGIWQAHYEAIAAANHALQSIELMGNPPRLAGSRAEALLARAYGHFVLVNIFAQHYSSRFAITDLGIPYIKEPETTLNPHYERPTVQEVYNFLKADIEEALNLVTQSRFSVPSYHFNSEAAYAFAARFSLYMEEWEAAENYASQALGTQIQSVLRNNTLLGAVPGEIDQASYYYSSSEHRTNFLLLGSYSSVGVYFGPYYLGSRYTHGSLLSSTETLTAPSPWGIMGSNDYRSRVYFYLGTNLDKILVAKNPVLFEYTDPVARIGFNRTVSVIFNAEETLLVRAEARIHQNKLTEALADLNLWKSNTILTFRPDLTVNNLRTWAEAVAYHSPENPTIKKNINPTFPIPTEDQRNALYALLHIRRVETIHTGLRWFDIKRYGITVHRRLISTNNEVLRIYPDPLIPRDLRAAFQIPQDVRDAGLTPNPR